MADAQIAIGTITATASSYAAWAGSAVAHGMDNNTGTMWLSDTTAGYDWYKLDLGSAKTVTKVRLLAGNANDHSFAVQWSADDSTWTTVGYIHLAGIAENSPVEVTFPAKSARYWRVIQTNPGTYARFKEILIFEDTSLSEGGGYASPFASGDPRVLGVDDIEEWRYNGGAAFSAIWDANDATYWTFGHNGSYTAIGTNQSTDAAERMNLGQDFNIPLPVYVVFRTETDNDQLIALYGSDDGATWTKVSADVDPTVNTDTTIGEGAGVWYRWWKVSNAASGGYGRRVNKLYFYVDSSVYALGQGGGESSSSSAPVVAGPRAYTAAPYGQRWRDPRRKYPHASNWKP